MANPIIKIKRGATAPVATLNAGEFAIDQVAKNLYLGVEVGGAVTNEIVGGEGTFATKAYVTTALGGVSGTLGNMAVQNKETINITGGTIDAVDITGGSVQNTVIDGTAIGATTPSTGTFTTLTATTLDGNINAFTAVIDQLALTNSIIDSTTIGATTPSSGAFTNLQVTSGDLLMTGGNIDMNSRQIVHLGAPVSANDAVRKTDLDSAISALGAVFHYAGNVSDATTPFDLATLPYQTTGSYYRVDVAGTYVDPVHPNASFEAKVGDAFVLSVASGFQKIDNVDVEVLPTANEIAVTGDENAGYTVSIDPVFSGRVSTTENKTQNFGVVVAGSTEINGGIWGNGSMSLDGGIESGGNIDAYNGNISASGTVSGTNITVLETKTQNITAIAGETDVAGILTSQELWVGPSSTDAVKLLNAGGGTQAILEMPVGKEFVVKTDSGANAITVKTWGKVEFGGDVQMNGVLDANVVNAAGGSNFQGSALFQGGINLSTGNLVGNGTNEITDFVIDGGSY